MQDQRELMRRHLIYYLRIFDRKEETLLGHLIDITSEGLMLMSDQKIETGKIFQLRMNLPEELLGSKYLELEAKSRWCRPDVNPDFYDTGFEITQIDQREAKLVNRLIDKFGFHF